MVMKNWKTHWKRYVFWIAVAEGVGVLSGWLTREGTKVYNAVVEQPPLSPPSAAFPIVWSILFLLMGIGAARVSLSPPSADRNRALSIFVVQLAVNFFWSIIFFNFQNFGFALAWLLMLWVLILWMIAAFWRVDRPAALMQIPYAVWVTFAAYLNFGVWALN